MLGDRWKSCILSPDESIRAAIDNLVKSSTKIVLVVSNAGEFLGTVCDGDIRRGLLKGIELDSKLAEIIHRPAIVASPEMSRENVKSLMLAHKIQQIPILDEDGVLRGLHEWDDLEVVLERENLFVVMAGGEGRRLMPHTLNTPKPMVLVRGKPMLEHILVKAKANGFRNFVLVVHHMSQVIEEYFGDGSKWEVNVRYIREKKPLGTAGGLAHLSGLDSDPVVVTNGDVISDVNYSEILDFHLKNHAIGTMAVRQHQISHPFGVVNLDGMRITDIVEKPIQSNYINAGVYVISTEAISSLEKDTFMNMTDFFAILLTHTNKVCAYPLYESWVDVGSPEDLREITSKFDER